jgi:hypothetical protein
MLGYEKINNFFLVGDIAHVAWHGSGDWALLVGSDGSLAQYDPMTAAILTLPSLDGTPRDVGESPTSDSIVITGLSNGSAALWRVDEDELGQATVINWDLALIGDEATCAVPEPGSDVWAICTRTQNAGAYINRLYRVSYEAGILDSKAYSSGAGISDAMWTQTAYPGSNALVTTEGYNGSGSQSWVLVSDTVIGNGWSPGFGNAGRAQWRPNGSYGVVVGTSTNSVYVFDGAWQSTKTPAPNNGASGNAIAWRSDGTRALVVARPTGLPLQGSVFEHRPINKSQYDSEAWTNVSISGFDEAPYNGSFNTHLLDVSWRPGSACDEGIIVGADNGTTFNPTFGLVIRFYDEDDPDCL